MSHLFVGFVVFVSHFLGCVIGCYFTKQKLQQEAIKRGYAYWHTNEDGSTEFRWKETTK